MMSLVHTGRRKYGLAVAVAISVAMIAGIGPASAAAEFPEFAPLEKNAATLSGGEVTFEAKEGLVPVHCTKVTAGVELLNVKEFTSGKIILTGCTAVLSGSCTSEGAAKGEIITSAVKMRLAYIAKTSKEVGLVINYAKSGEVLTLANFKCEKTLTKATLRGPVIARLTPVNTFTQSFALGLKGSKGVQEVTQYESEGGGKVTAFPEASFNGGTFKQADFNIPTLELHWIKNCEIVA
jgi:hypothetical protein